MRCLVTLLTFVFWAAVAMAESPKSGQAVPIVPDATTAVRIAEAVSEARFGAALVARFRPYRAKLEGDEWSITGTPQDGSSKGAACLKLASRIDGRVSRLSLSR